MSDCHTIMGKLASISWSPTHTGCQILVQKKELGHQLFCLCLARQPYPYAYCLNPQNTYTCCVLLHCAVLCSLCISVLSACVHAHARVLTVRQDIVDRNTKDVVLCDPISHFGSASDQRRRDHLRRKEEIFVRMLQEIALVLCHEFGMQ